MTEHDEAILKAAEELTQEWAADRCHLSPRYKALYNAIAAKKEAERPKLLSAEEAQKTFLAVVNADASRAEWDGCPVPLRDKALQAVLTEAHARALKVIEALPSIVQQMDATGAYVLVPPRADGYDTRDRYVRLSDIHRALTSARGDQS